MKRVILLKNKAEIADQCHVAECFWDRLRGLIGRSGLTSGHGMLFPKCSSIHMWFMRFPIDVVFLDEQGRVTSVHSDVRPWRALPIHDFKARDALELPAGTARKHGISVGDGLCIS